LARPTDRHLSENTIRNRVFDVDENFIYTSGTGTTQDANSSETALGGGAVFTGVKFDATNLGIVFVSVFSDVASATDGLSIQQSKDGTNWDWTDEYTVPANSGKTYSIQPALQWIRVLYTNGAGAQTSFRLSTVGKSTMALDSSHRIQDAIVDEDDARLRKSVLTARQDSNVFVNISATDSGNLRIGNAEDGLAIAKGDVTNTNFIHKFGSAPDFDVADGFVTVWDGAEDDTTWELMNYVYSATANIDRISSSDNGDTEDIEIQGLDTNYDLVTQTITLTGQTPASLTTSLIRVFRLKNVGSTNLVGHVFCFVNVATTGGVPNTVANIRAVVQPDNNQTEMAVYTIPAGYTGYMRDWYASTAGAKRDSTHTIKMLARPFGQVFQLKHKSNIDVTGTSYIQHKYTEPEVFTEKTDIEMQMDTDQDIAGVAAGFDIVLVAN
jgi:hypothetical protein